MDGIKLQERGGKLTGGIDWSCRDLGRPPHPSAHRLIHAGAAPDEGDECSHATGSGAGRQRVVIPPAEVHVSSVQRREEMCLSHLEDSFTQTEWICPSPSVAAGVCTLTGGEVK